MSIVALVSSFALMFISTYDSLRCVALLSLCLSTKQQYNFSLNNFQYYLIKLSLLILLQISLQLNDGSSQLMVLINTINSIDIIYVNCSISVNNCINIHLNSMLHRTFITLFINKTTIQFQFKQLPIFYN